MVALVSRASSSRERPGRRHAARLAAIRFNRSLHSGPKVRASSLRMRAASPGLLPPVETVSSRSPRRTWAGLWKSQSVGDVLDVDQAAGRARRAGERRRLGERQIDDPHEREPRQLVLVREPTAQPHAGAGRKSGGRRVREHRDAARRRPGAAARGAARRRCPRPTRPSATRFGSTISGIMARCRARRADHAGRSRPFAPARRCRPTLLMAPSGMVRSPRSSTTQELDRRGPPGNHAQEAKLEKNCYESCC